MSSIPISEVREPSLAEKLRLAVDLAEPGLDMMRAKLEREHPDANSGEIQLLLVAWLRTRPGAVHGDAEGRPAPGRFSGT